MSPPQNDVPIYSLVAKLVEAKCKMYWICLDVVVRAAKEYFNASGSHDDQNMRLAETCLNLFPNAHEKIKEELDLIAVLPLLQDFKVILLPLKGDGNNSIYVHVLLVLR